MIQLLGILLLISLAGNAFLFHSRDTALAEKSSLETSLAGWKGSAEACTASVDRLAKTGDARYAKILKKLEEDLPRIKGLQHEAIEAARARPTNPNDLCGSLLQELRTRIKQERAK